MNAHTDRGAILPRSEFVYSSFDWGRSATPVGPVIGAEKVRLDVVELLPLRSWHLEAAVAEENVVVVFAGSGEGDVAGQSHKVGRSSALHAPTGRTLGLHAGSEGLVAYVWRTRLAGDEQRVEQPRLSNELGNTETQLRGFSGTGEVDEDSNTAVMNFLFWPGTGSCRLCLHCGVMEPGQVFNVHVHPESEEAFIAFEGRGQLYLDDRWHDAIAGDVLFAPPGIPHGTRHPGADSGLFATCGGPTPFDPVLYERAGVSTRVR